LSRSLQARRANPLAPEQSLLLQKPTMQLAHEGGRRFHHDSLEYDILKRWIAGGMQNDLPKARTLQSLVAEPSEQVLIDPQRCVQLKVTASWSDGQQTDVSALAVYEPSHQTVDIGPGGLVERLDFGEVTVVVRFLQLQVPVR